MNDYIAIMLNGICTGMGVIIAHELWNNIREYHRKANNILKEARK